MARAGLLLVALVGLPGCTERTLEVACMSQCERTARTFEEAEACREQCRAAERR